MRRWAPLLAILAGCALREPRLSGVAGSCASSGQCSHSDVCFLGECRGPAASLAVVRVEVRPPSGSTFGLRSLQVDLGKSVLNDFTLSVPLVVGPDTGVPGTVLQAQDPAPPKSVAGATVTFTDQAPAIPDRVERIVAVSDASGAYSARLPQGKWEVLVQPPPPLPPVRFGAIDTASPVLNYVLPATTSLAQLEGGVTANGSPLAGASVTAVEAGGAAISAPALSQADGGYALYLAPNSSSQPALQIGPPVDADAGAAPQPSQALDPFPTYQPIQYAPTVNVDLPAVATVEGQVLDFAGNGVPSARVYARSSGGTWTLARSVVADASGGYALTLRAGTYLVQAAPATDPSSPALSVQQSVTAPASSVNLTCPLKVRRYGQVLDPDGHPVRANFQVTAPAWPTAW